MKVFVLSFVQLTLLALMPSLCNGLGYYDNATCGAFPDPHFSTWDNMYYDFQGGCDVVLIKKLADPAIPGDDSIEVHLATEPRGGYSAIVEVGVRINSDEHIFPGPPLGPPLADPFGGFATTVDNAIPAYTINDIDLGGGHFIRISEWNPSSSSWSPGLSVQVHGNGAMFSNTEGMCGNWNIGGVTERGGSAFPTTDTTDWAEHWEVQPGEKIFPTPVNANCTGPAICGQDFPLPPPPDGDLGGEFPCPRKEGQEGWRGIIPVAPSEEKTENVAINQKLNSNHGVVTEKLNKYPEEVYILKQEDEMCTRSCNDIPKEYPELRANCIYDVTVTGFSEYACQRAYTHPVIIKQPPTCPDDECVSVKQNLCEKNRGKCVKDCVTSLKYTCNPKLCMKEKEVEMEEPKQKLKGNKERDEKDKKGKCACQIPVRNYPELEAQLMDA